MVAGTCMCNCSGGFSGLNCESECILRSVYKVGIALILPIIYICYKSM